MPATETQIDTLAAHVADEIIRHFDDRTTAWRIDGCWEVHFCETPQVSVKVSPGCFVTAPRAIASVGWCVSDGGGAHRGGAVAEIAWIRGEAPPLLANKVERILREELPATPPSQIVR